VNHDDRLHRALADQADAILLTPGDAGSVMRRGAARRNRRRGAVVAVAALAVVATSLAVVDRGEPDATVDSGVAATLVASPYDWTAVSPRSGLGYSGSVAELDGAVYRLSTAPGPVDPDAVTFEPHLYRSEDGAEWAEVSLPDGMRPSSLTASDGALYAVGTAPAGGDTRSVVVSASVDGASSWTSVTLPSDVAELESRFPGQVQVGQPMLAALDASHLVAAVTVSATPDIEALLPDEADPEAGWEITPEGVTLYRLEPCTDGEAAGCVPGPTSTVAADPVAVDGAITADRAASEPKVAGTYTWDELGIDPELRDLIVGRTYVYASDDGATFSRADLPEGTVGSNGQVLATADGYWLVLSAQQRDAAVTRVLRSADGRTWTGAGSLPGWVGAAGVLAGRLAVGVYGVEGPLTVQLSQADGSWLPLDLVQAVGMDPTKAGVGELAFGPLGLAATVWEGEEAYLVHSADGSTVSAVRLADHLTGPLGGVLGLDVSADAITVRVGGAVDDDPATPPTQQVLVGTPR
jgi:hypothetical protein